LEIPIPYVLKIIERVSYDLRDMLDNVPFSHVLTLHDLKRGQQAIVLARKSYKLYSAGQLLLNPVQAVLHETQARKTEDALRYQVDDLKAWLLRSYIEKVGYYAIALYSGELTLDNGSVTDEQTPVSRKDRKRVEESHAIPEPLRVLVLGQINAGKSSLINALFGELRAPVDTLAHTDSIIPYSLQREGLEQALIFDTAGYQESACEISKNMLDAICHSDLVLLVCSAANAARNADRVYLDALRDYYRDHPDRRQPPVLVVLSHIDRLRPMREWQPPYNIVAPDSTKAHNIRQALETVAVDLVLPYTDVIPVNLQPAHWYNIEEGVIPALLNHLDSAQHSRYLRCLRNRQKAEFWQHLREQATKMGTIIIDKGKIRVGLIFNKK
jgi:predicted GTPase